MKNFFLLLCLTLLFFQTKLTATSIIPFRHLGEAAQVSDAVVLATAESDFETEVGKLVFYDHHFRVKSRVKGDLSGGEIFTLRQFSHRLGGMEGEIAGDFVPEKGKTYLLFLQKQGDVWRPITLSYYVFEIKLIGDEEFLVPLEESLGIVLVARPDGIQPESLGIYRVSEMLRLLENYSSNKTNVWNTSSALSGLTFNDFAQERALPTGCDFDLGSGLARWQNAGVSVYHDATNKPSNTNSILANVLSEMNTEYTGIDPTDAGETNFSPNCSDNTVAGQDFLDYCDDFLNGAQSALIFFDDPCNQIPNLSNCMGILAIGGGYTSSVTHSYKGDTWKNAGYGYVVVNNGTYDCLTTSDFEIMMIHELTHVYRMDHLNAGAYPNQNMNPSCCNAINTKDRECMNYTYELAAPVELTAFNVRPFQERQVQVTWTTASEKDNDFFIIERSADGFRFEIINTEPGRNTLTVNDYEWIDPLPYPGVNYYRLSQVDFDGQSSNLGLKAVQIESEDGRLSIFPNPTNDSETTVVADFSDYFNGVLEISNARGIVIFTQSLSLEKGRNAWRQSVENLPVGVYWLRLENETEVRAAKFFKR